MSKTVNDNFKFNTPKAADERTGKFSGGAWQAYATVAEAIAAVPLAYRAEGLTVRIKNAAGKPVEWHWFEGTTDNHLKLKHPEKEQVTLTGLNPAWASNEGHTAKITAGGSINLAYSADTVPAHTTLFFYQDGAGSRTLAVNGQAVEVNPAASSCTLIGLAWDGVTLKLLSDYSASTVTEPPTGNTTPAAPTFTAFDDTANTVTLVPASGVPMGDYRWYITAEGASQAVAVPSNGVISFGDLEGSVTAYSIASGTRNQSPNAVSQPFTTGDNSTPAAPTFTGFDDTADTVTLVPVSGIPMADYRYRVTGDPAVYTVPANGLISVGDISGHVYAWSIAAGSRNQSPEGASDRFNLYQRSLYVLSGADQNIAVANETDFHFALNQPFSFGFYSDVAISNVFIAGRSQGTARSWEVEVRDGSVGMVIWEQGSNNYLHSYSSGSIGGSASALFVFTYDGSGTAGGIKIYKNVAAIPLTIGGQPSINAINDIGTFNIGLVNGVQSGGATIENLFIANKALSQAEITAYYNNGFVLDLADSQFYSSLLAHWRFDKNLLDSKGEHHGTATSPIYTT